MSLSSQRMLVTNHDESEWMNEWHILKNGMRHTSLNSKWKNQSRLKQLLKVQL